LGSEAAAGMAATTGWTAEMAAGLEAVKQAAMVGLTAAALRVAVARRQLAQLLDQRLLSLWL